MFLIILCDIVSNTRTFFCRSTNPREGEMIAWKLCAKMLSLNGLSMNGEFYKNDENVKQFILSSKKNSLN